jgi:DNA-binding NarL/FixJ family response regulator
MAGRRGRARAPAITASVLIVEDHLAIAEALLIALDRTHDLEVVGSVGMVGEAIQEAARRRPDVMLVDYHLPDGTGADVATAMRSQADGPAVVMITADDNDDVLLRSLEAGVAGFVLKSASLAEICDVIRLAATGELALPPTLLTQVIALQRERAQRHSEREVVLKGLTKRELEVLRLICQGLDNRSIADSLGVGVTTVRGHVQKILEKLEVHSKLAAMVRGTELGLG